MRSKILVHSHFILTLAFPVCSIKLSKQMSGKLIKPEGSTLDPCTHKMHELPQKWACDNGTSSLPKRTPTGFSF